MSDRIKIAVDAMGGDGSPKKIIDGIILNHSKNKSNFFKIFGDKNQIFPLINKKIPLEFFVLEVPLPMGLLLNTKNVDFPNDSKPCFKENIASLT